MLKYRLVEGWLSLRRSIGVSRGSEQLTIVYVLALTFYTALPSGSVQVEFSTMAAPSLVWPSSPGYFQYSSRKAVGALVRRWPEVQASAWLSFDPGTANVHSFPEK